MKFSIKMPSITTYSTATLSNKCRYAVCQISVSHFLIVILNVVILTVVAQNAIIQNVAASFWHNNTLNVSKLGTEFTAIARKDETMNVVCSHILLGQRSESDWTKMSRDHN
jgi:hypothetical protein